MSIPKIWEEEFQVRSFQMDPKQRAHLTTIANLLQEVAGNHASHAGFGFEDMGSRNQVWVLARLKIVVDDYPKWQDVLKVITWSRGRKGIFYLRDFLIKNKAGDLLVSATSSWAAINRKSRRPELVKDLEDRLYSNKDEVAIDDELGRIPELENPQGETTRTVEYTDIDLVYHVNNVKYIEYVLNSFPAERLLNQHISTFEINYLGEAKYGEEIRISKEQLDESEFGIEIIRQADQKPVCRARLSWEKN